MIDKLCPQLLMVTLTVLKRYQVTRDIFTTRGSKQNKMQTDIPDPESPFALQQ